MSLCVYLFIYSVIATDEAWTGCCLCCAICKPLMWWMLQCDFRRWVCTESLWLFSVENNSCGNDVPQETLQSHPVGNTVVSWNSSEPTKDHASWWTDWTRTILPWWRISNGACTADSNVSAWKYYSHHPQSSKELAVSLSPDSCPWW